MGNQKLGKRIRHIRSNAIPQPFDKEALLEKFGSLEIGEPNWIVSLRTLNVLAGILAPTSQSPLKICDLITFMSKENWEINLKHHPSHQAMVREILIGLYNLSLDQNPL